MWKAICTVGLLFLIGCSKQQSDKKGLHFKAIVFYPSDINCQLPLLYFGEDSVAIRNFTGRQDLLYLAVSLPSEYGKKDNRLLVDLRQLISEEDFPCITLGPSFPKLKVVSVSSR